MAGHRGVSLVLLDTHRDASFAFKLEDRHRVVLFNFTGKACLQRIGKGEGSRVIGTKVFLLIE